MADTHEQANRKERTAERQRIRTTVLEKAQAIVTGSRKEEYGGAEDSFDVTAALWSVTLGVPVEAWQVALMLGQLKQARLIGTGGKHLDSWVDSIGYASCGAAAAMRETAEGDLV